MDRETAAGTTDATRVALVTGATGAIGSETASRLVDAGWTVALIARDDERAERIAEGLGAAAIPFHAEACDSASIDAAFADVEARVGVGGLCVRVLGKVVSVAVVRVVMVFVPFVV